MTAARLLRLYPRAWRDRYGDELLELAGTAPLQPQQIVDIVSGAIDAWLSSDVRRAARLQAQHSGGTHMVRAVSICQHNETRYTKRDGAIGAAVMIASTLAFALLGLALQGSGFSLAATVVLNSSFMFSMTLSIPFWLMKGQPRKAQVAIIGGTIALLLVINAIAAFS